MGMIEPDELEKVLRPILTDESCPLHIAAEIDMNIELMPKVDAVPVRHGHWIYHPDWQADGECGYECSACGMGSDVDYQFCMRCGAVMDGKDGEHG